MSVRLWVGTRKGLFVIERGSGGWKVVGVHFLADHVTMVLPLAREKTWFAGLDLSHFGAKLHRSRDGATWEEVSAPVYPPQPEGHVEKDNWGNPWTWKLMKIWSFESG